MNITKVVIYTFAAASIISVVSAYAATGVTASILFGSAVLFTSLNWFFIHKSLNSNHSTADSGKSMDKNALLLQKLRQQQQQTAQSSYVPTQMQQPVVPVQQKVARPAPDDREWKLKSALKQIEELKAKMSSLENNQPQDYREDAELEVTAEKESNFPRAKVTTLMDSFSCPICGLPFDKEHQMNMHIISKHKDEFRNRITQ